MNKKLEELRAEHAKEMEILSKKRKISRQSYKKMKNLEFQILTEYIEMKEEEQK